MDGADHLFIVMKGSVEFLHKYSWMFDYKVTRLLADEVLDSIPTDWKEFLLKTSINEFNRIFLEVGDSPEVNTGLLPESVNEFVRERNNVLRASVVLERKLDCSKLSWCQKRGVKAKKEHEVVNLASLVVDQCQSVGVSKVVDIGCGLGYLGEELMRRDLQVASTFQCRCPAFSEHCAGNWH